MIALICPELQKQFQLLKYRFLPQLPVPNEKRKNELFSMIFNNWEIIPANIQIQYNRPLLYLIRTRFS